MLLLFLQSLPNGTGVFAQTAPQSFFCRSKAAAWIAFVRFTTAPPLESETETVAVGIRRWRGLAAVLPRGERERTSALYTTRWDRLTDISANAVTPAAPFQPKARTDATLRSLHCDRTGNPTSLCVFERDPAEVSSHGHLWKHAASSASVC